MITIPLGPVQHEPEQQNSFPDSSHNGRCYQRILSNGLVNECFTKAKKCFSFWYGSPHPPLTRQQAAGQYCEAGTFLAGAAAIGLLSTWVIFAQQTACIPEEIPPYVYKPLFALYDLGTAHIFAEQVKKIVKTWKAPTVVEGQDFLPANCFSFWYGPPYPPLTRRQAVGQYCEAGVTLASAAAIELVSMWVIFARKASCTPEEIPPAVYKPAFALFDLAAANVMAEQIKKLVKTCKAPRVAEEQGFLRV